MHPKIRSPFISWLLTVLTGGIYIFFWAWQVASELNSAEQKQVFPVKLWRNTAIVLYGLALVGVLLAINSQTPLLFITTCLCLLGFILYIQVSIGNYIKNKDVQLNTGSNFSNAVSILLFWLVANTGVAYMQSGINRIIRHEQARS
jgi:glucan phosphoethanolaminetransferase (alkaline phosphatase superfamily)